MKNSQSLLKKSQPSLTPPENFPCNHPENLSKPLNNSQPPGTFLNPPENFTHTLKISQPPLIFLTPPPSPKTISTPPEYNLNPSEKISTSPEKISTPPKKNRTPSRKNVNSSQKISSRPPKNCQPLPKKCHLYRKNLTPPEIILTP